MSAATVERHRHGVTKTLVFAVLVAVLVPVLGVALFARIGGAPAPPPPLAAVLTLAREREADLPLPAGFAVRELGPRYGYYNPLTDRIVVDDFFLAGRDCARMQKLYEILVHEAWHRREPLRAMLAPWRHPHIYAASQRRAALARPSIGACAGAGPG